MAVACSTRRASSSCLLIQSLGRPALISATDSFSMVRHPHVHGEQFHRPTMSSAGVARIWNQLVQAW
eukprot:12317830-Heterocapsa_arctica.AAC.1